MQYKTEYSTIIVTKISFTVNARHSAVLLTTLAQNIVYVVLSRVLHCYTELTYI